MKPYLSKLPTLLWPSGYIDPNEFPNKTPRTYSGTLTPVKTSLTPVVSQKEQIIYANIGVMIGDLSIRTRISQEELRDLADTFQRMANDMDDFVSESETVLIHHFSKAPIAEDLIPYHPGWQNDPMEE